MRARPTRLPRLVGAAVAFALVFAPGEALGSGDAPAAEATTSDMAAAVLAPTFVSTPLSRPDPPAVVERAGPTTPDEGAARTFLPAAALVAAGLLVPVLRRARVAGRRPPITVTPPWFPAWRLRAPPLPSAPLPA